MTRTVLASVWPPTAVAAGNAGHEPMSPIEAIRRKCLDCSGHQPSEVKLCEATGCPLWPFRAGRHPYTKRALQEADFGAPVAGGINMPLKPRSSENSPHEPSFRQDGAIASDSPLGNA